MSRYVKLQNILLDCEFGMKLIGFGLFCPLIHVC